MSEFKNDIERIADEMMKDGTVEEIVKKKIANGFSEAIENSFRWGELNKAIKARVNEVMVPYVERFDLSDSLVKLDAVLTEIVNSTVLTENKELLENFKYLMIEPKEKTIKLSEIFEKYKEFVANNIDTSGRNVNTDDFKPYYDDAAVSYEVGHIDRHWSNIDQNEVLFETEEEEQPELNFTIELTRWTWERKEGYDMRFSKSDNISSLRHMNDFELLLLKISRAGVRVIIDKDCDDDSVTPNKQPEYSFD